MLSISVRTCIWIHQRTDSMNTKNTCGINHGTSTIMTWSTHSDSRVRWESWSPQQQVEKGHIAPQYRSFRITPEINISFDGFSFERFFLWHVLVFDHHTGIFFSEESLFLREKNPIFRSESLYEFLLDFAFRKLYL
jgi:hypothetical protein